jgi:pyruvate/2-oxoglutarate/acetoin dehydrogenase E1 component
MCWGCLVAGPQSYPFTNRRPTKAGSRAYDAKGLLTTSLRERNPLLLIERIAFSAAKQLDQHGISTKAIDLPAIAPLDQNSIDWRGGRVWL